MHPDVRLMSVPFLYRDDALVIVNKPSGMLVHRSPGARDPIVVMMAVRDVVGGYTWPVHRLDRATSGAVIVAIDQEAARRLSRLFHRGRVSKTYLALVAGVPPASGRIEIPLEKKDQVLQEAVTEYERLATAEGLTLIRVRPQQGRRHQIRRHFQQIGFPLVGDTQYGDPLQNERAAETFGLARLGLHSSRVAFAHPLTGAPIDVEAPLPDDLFGPLRAMHLEVPR